MFKSAFCGRIEEIPGISVDNFENAKEVRARAYFLSHCHSDHTQGLYSEALIDALEKSGAFIYMSEPSAAIVGDENTDSRLMKYVKPLSLGRNSITLPSDPTEGLEELHMTVILINASHSFGSVMFLFKTTRTTVLFTGDFRMPPSDLPKYTYFHDGMDPITIDAMYVDTTFIGHRYLNFPKRSESVESTVEAIKKHLRHPSGRIALHTSARYGYEFVYNDIYKKLGMKVYVGEARWKFYSKLPHLVPGVTNDESTTKIHLCRNITDKKDHTKCMATIQNEDDLNYLYIHFSAMKWDNYVVDDDTCNRISAQRLDVCFATHCSRSELLYFVNYFRPRKVVGFPEDFPTEKNVDSFKVVSKKRKTESKEEVAVKIDKKVDRNLLREMFEI